MTQLESLTPRKKEVLKLIALDLTPDEIAVRLNISRKGVEYHSTALRLQFKCGIAGLTRLAIGSELVKLKRIKWS